MSMTQPRPVAGAPSAQSTPATQRPVGPLMKIVRLHFADPQRMIGVPLFIFGSVIVLCIVIMALLRNFVPATPAELSEGFRYNQATLWCFAGYFVSIGVMAYARTMPFALGMGSTRRQYFAGTCLALLLESAFIGVTMTVLLALEKATGHWFNGARVFDVVATGDGNYLSTFLMGFGLSAAMLFIGAMFAVVFLRWNQKGVIAVIFGTVAVLLALLWLLLTAGVNPFLWFEGATFAKIALVMILVALISAVGSWLVLRRAPVGQ
ncbi:hypothetical protein [Arthrobacter rhombi]|uniref:hypothetical protein n=1 Tax=Arthrobacter rhombi TaxID=71253 RepID=UPI003FD11B7E